VTLHLPRLLSFLVVAICASGLAVSEGAGAALPQTQLRASDKSNMANFGTSVALRGDLALIGAPELGAAGNGAAYVFRFDGSSWNEEQKLFASDGTASASFGISVALGDAGVAFVGAHQDDESAANGGAAYVYRYDGATWVFDQKLLAGDPGAGDDFGYSVALDGDSALIGARRDNHTNLVSPGSIYLFAFNGMQWLEASKQVTSDPAAKDEFGNSVSLADSTLLGGSWQDDDGGSLSGSAYLFGVGPPEKLVAPDAGANDLFGVDVALLGDWVLVGARADDEDGTDAGAAYLFHNGLGG
jgi:hypothetical protein